MYLTGCCDHHAGHQEEQRGISSELHTRIVGRFLVGFYIHDNSWVSDVNSSSHAQSAKQTI